MTARLQALRARIGGEVRGAQGVFPGPGHSRRDRSLSVLDIGSRLVAHSFAGDPFAHVAAYLNENGVEMAPARPLSAAEAREVKRLQAIAKAEQEALNAQRRAAALALWERAGPLRGDALAYFASRGIRKIPDGADLRFLPDCPRRPYTPDGLYAPAIAALVTDPYGQPLGLHLTYLRQAARMHRLMLAPQAGGMVRLGAADKALAIAEGIETALSFSQLSGVPCWAARSALGLEQFRPPPGVQSITIAADGDEPGRKAAAALAVVLRSFVRVEVSEAPDGLDWNDVLGGGKS